MILISKYTWKILAAVLSVFVLAVFSGAGCMTADPGKKDREITITSGNFEQICGMQWILKEMVSNGAPIELSGEPPYIQFEKGGKIGGFASINRFFGHVKVDDKGLVTIPPMGSTMMAGPPALMAQERAFLKSFQETYQFSMQGIYLSAHSKDKSTQLVFYVPIQ